MVTANQRGIGEAYFVSAAMHQKKLPADFLLSARQRTFHSQNAVSCLLIPGQARWVSAAVSVVFHLQKTA